jgi:hypothetical protein
VKPHILIWTPCALGVTRHEYVASLIASTAILVREKVDFSYGSQESSSIVGSRNEAVKVVLDNPHITHLLFIDADMSWDEPEAIKTLLDLDEDVVCGVYTTKGRKPGWVIRSDGKAFDRHPSKDLLKFSHVPTGFMLIRRSVFANIVREKPDLKINFFSMTEEEKNVYLIFDQRRSDPTPGELSHYLTDDFGFSETCTKVGIDLWVYPRLTFSHHWMTHNKASFQDTLDKLS